VPDYRALARRICGRRAKLQKKAFQLGARFYADKPGRFGKQLDRWLRRKGKIL
jgi:hypothetical protein